jgi:hypothetical protein
MRPAVPEKVDPVGSADASGDGFTVTGGRLPLLPLSSARREVGMICLLRWLIALLLTAPLATLGQEGRAQTAAGSGAVGARAEPESPGAGPRGSRGTSGMPELEARIDSQVLALSTESLAESLAKLDRQEMYRWPGPSPYRDNMVTVEFPLPKDVGQEDVENLVSSRRFLKVYEELMLLDRSKSGALVLERLRASRPIYEKLLDEYVAQPWFRDLSAPDKEPNVIGGSQCSDNKDGSPTLYGTRFEVLALVLLAGVLKLEAAHAEIVELAEYTCRQRQSFSDPKAYNLRVGFRTLWGMSLYNRQILGTALLLTLPSVGSGDPALPPGVTWVEKRLTKYKAVYTTYDLPVTMRGLRPDFSQGTQTMRYLSPLDDASFDAIVTRCR